MQRTAQRMNLNLILNLNPNPNTHSVRFQPLAPPLKNNMSKKLGGLLNVNK